MSVSDYLNKYKGIYESLMTYLEEPDDSEAHFQEFLSKLDHEDIKSSKSELKIFFNILSSICSNHYREVDFLKRIEQIIREIENDLKNHFSSSEIFEIFKDNRRIILFLIEEQIIIRNDSLMNQIINENKQSPFYFDYFYREMMNDPPEDCKAKQNLGENDSYICSLIRKDSVEEFITYINRENLSVSSTIQPSIFETNSFLVCQKPSLIEYAAFYGSIEIFQYLQMNNAEISPYLWYYSIHGKKAEIIHLLEGYNLDPPNNDYIQCYKEAIKCHHNDIANYFLNNFLNSNQPMIEEIVQYFNFALMEEDLIDESFFFYLCENDYNTFVKLLMNEKNLNVNKLTIFFC